MAPDALAPRVAYVDSGHVGIHADLDRYILRALRRLGCAVFRASPADLHGSRLDELGRFEPHLVFTQWGLLLPREMVEWFRDNGWTTAVWSVEDPYDIDLCVRVLSAYDVVFTIEKACVDVYRQAGCRRVYYLPAAASEDVYRPAAPDPALESDVCLVARGFPNRRAIIDAASHFLAGLKCRIAGDMWEGLRDYDLLRPALLPPVSAEEASRLYANARICLNIHRPPDFSLTGPFNAGRIPALSPNLRVFEVACAGGFLLTDPRDDLPSFYDVGSEVAVFRSAEELVEQVGRYLARDGERRAMAARARARTLAQHTYTHRLRRVLEVAL